jgi:hypothetical protein
MPNPDWTIRADAHALKLTSAQDSWYAGGGAFESGSFGYTARPGRARALARVIDASIEYRAGAAESNAGTASRLPGTFGASTA